jgi:hypothetical protein
MFDVHFFVTYPTSLEFRPTTVVKVVKVARKSAFFAKIPIKTSFYPPRNRLRRRLPADLSAIAPSLGATAEALAEAGSSIPSLSTTKW